MTIKEIILENIEKTLGFPNFLIVKTFVSIAHIFKKNDKRCGIYILKFSNNLYYIGQAIDVVRRFSQHAKIHKDIEKFTFLSVEQNKLNEEERSLIYRAESMGLLLKNSIHVSSIIGDTDFDSIVDETEQQKWLASKTRYIDALHSKRIIKLPEQQKVRFSKNYEIFLSSNYASKASSLLKRYILECIPIPFSSEYSFWSVSCTPSTNKNTHPRLFCVNAASMEIFVIGTVKKTKENFALVTVDEEVLMEHWPDPDSFSINYPSLVWFDRSYRDAGQNQVTFLSNNLDEVSRLLNDPGFCQAAASLNLRVMRKRSNLYAKYHCPQLIDKIIES